MEQEQQTRRKYKSQQEFSDWYLKVSRKSWQLQGQEEARAGQERVKRDLNVEQILADAEKKSPDLEEINLEEEAVRGLVRDGVEERFVRQAMREIDNYVSNGAVIKKMAGEVAEVIKGAGVVVEYFGKWAIGGAYFAPTFSRRFREKLIEESGKKTYEDKVIIGWITSVPFVANIGASVGTYAYTRNPAFLIPIAVQAGTTAASGIYEWFRYEKNKMSEERAKSEN